MEVAYLTVLERRILRYIQFRKGLNKLGFLLEFYYNHLVKIKFSDKVKMIK